MKHGTLNRKAVKQFFVTEIFPSGKSRNDSRVYKTFEGAYKRLLALQESNNNSAMYEDSPLNNYQVVSLTKTVIC